MEYSVSCPCGLVVPIAATQAGTTITCRCGRTLAVPKLSDLRRAEGRNSYEAGVIDTIGRMIQRGELPWGDACALSGRPTRDVYELTVHCERPYAKSNDAARAGWGWLLLLGGLWLWLLWLARFGGRGSGGQVELHGRHTIVRVPLRVSEEFHDELRRTRSQRKLRKLLRTVPVYAQLLEEYDGATIIP